MYLRSLTLAGFKSFADSATLTFESGVTVVVGPNGSGKSNVVDAIAWVLGAQSPRSLRGQRMEDVVFAGTDRRKALGRAQVTLVIDNESQTLPTATAEVAITRTLFRSGESEYALNGTPCRLIDLQELLNDAGIGRQQHVIVAQGQIEQVLAARPPERRALIEEAAGVLKFRRRKERAERRLERTEANVTRLVDLQRELRRQIRPLERQAESARQHQELSAELADIQLYNAGRELAELHQAQSSADAQREELATQQESSAAMISEITSAITDAQAQLSQLTTEPGERLPRVASLSERARGLVAQTYERMRSVERERNALLDSDVVATLTDEYARLEAELAALDATPQHVSETDAAAEEADSCTQDAQQIAEAEQLQAQERLAVAAAALSEAEQYRQHASSELQHWIGRFEALSSAVAAARADAGVAATDGLIGVVGVLGDLVTIDDGWEAAVEAAADGALSAVVVRDNAAAAVTLGALVEVEGSGTVISFEELPSTAVSRDPIGCDSGGRNSADCDSDVREGHSTLGSSSAPDLSGDVVRAHVRVAADAPSWCHTQVSTLLDKVIGAAICVPGEWPNAYRRSLDERHAVFVTANGDRFGPRGWQIGTAGPIAAVGALQQARARLDDLTVRDREAAAAWVLARDAHSAALDNSLAVQHTVEKLQRQSETAAAQRAARDQAAADRAGAQRQRRLALAERLRAISQRLERHERTRANASAQLDRVEAIVLGLDHLARLLSNHRQRLDVQERHLRARQQTRTELVRQLNQRIDALAHQRDTAHNHQEQLRTQLAALDVADAQRVAKRDAVVSSLRLDLGADPTTALGASPPSLPEGVTAVDHERTVRADLQRLGPVNPLALSEFEAASERFEFVASQLADVRDGRRELHKVIRAIDNEIVDTFVGAFEDVARSFAELFEKLFPGGIGALSLTDPQDPLTCGVELDVRPAGKRIGRLSLLSGGERSLVALAYLFAVFRSRPSPFYVLDEVEAALDDVNLQRFLDLVAEFRRESQLIIVSHQRRTMEVADVLYGVSMPPAGASVVVSERPSRLLCEPTSSDFAVAESQQLAEPATASR